MCDIKFENAPEDWGTIDNESNPQVRAVLDADILTRVDTTPTEVLARLNGRVPLGTTTAVLQAFVDRGYTLFPEEDDEKEVVVVDLPFAVGELALADVGPDLPPQVA